MKNKTGKKVLSLLLATNLLFGIVPYNSLSRLFVTNASELTEGYYTYVIDGDCATIIGVDISISGNITVPSTLGGYTVTSIGDWAFYDCDSLTSITIPDSVTSVGDGAFYDCSSLTNITIPDSVTSIGYSAFEETKYYDDALNWENNVLYIDNHLIEAGYEISGNYIIKDGTKTIAETAFYGCNSLISIIIPDSIIWIGDTPFLACDSLIHIEVDNENLNYSGADGVLFNKNKTLLIQYPMGNIRTNYTVPNTVTTISDGAFFGCTFLNDITISDGVTSISDGAFFSCNSLKDITIPDSVTNIGDMAFFSCGSLKDITIPDSVTSIGDMAFKYCTSLTNIEVGEDNPNYSGADGVLFNKNKTLLIQYPMGNIRTNYTVPNTVTSICNFAFEVCQFLTGISIPDSVTSIGEGAFCDCASLTNITIPDGVTSIGYSAFERTEYYYNASNWENDVLYIGNHLIEADYEISGDYTIKDGTKTIADFAFYNCNSLTGITIPVSVTFIGNSAFGQCNTMQSAYFYGNAPNIGEEVFHDTLDSFTVYYLSNKTGYNSGSWLYFNRKTFSLAPENITSGTYSVNNTKNYVSRLKYGTTVSAFMSKINDSNYVKAYKGTNEITGSSLIGTGMLIKIIDDATVKKTYTAVVTGDINGDGKITLTDFVQLKAHILNKSPLSGAYASAADLNGDGKITLTDFVKAKAHLLGKELITPRAY